MLGGRNINGYGFRAFPYGKVEMAGMDASSCSE
jgi:hypothetical protein